MCTIHVILASVCLFVTQWFAIFVVFRLHRMLLRCSCMCVLINLHVIPIYLQPYGHVMIYMMFLLLQLVCLMSFHGFSNFISTSFRFFVYVHKLQLPHLKCQVAGGRSHNVLIGWICGRGLVCTRMSFREWALLWANIGFSHWWFPEFRILQFLMIIFFR